MDIQTFPTKGNLMAAQNTLRISKQGYDLMDKKRNVLIKEIMDLNEKAALIQVEIDVVFSEAYEALQRANIELGLSYVESLSHGISEECGIVVKNRSIMGVEIPLVSLKNQRVLTPKFGFGNTTFSLDEAYMKFNQVKELTIRLAMIENTAYRLAINIKKTQKRANALKNITIPKYEAMIKQIQMSLEERERDEFTRLKVISRKLQEDKGSL